ncbi:MAG: 16S rRNA (cytosine(1402)-N(4))-methyltransferase RsmH [bacterium]|nr:16S rRNA (cytosine(1402)-N(4))-methyltransferase RsmH [bacterium]
MDQTTPPHVPVLAGPAIDWLAIRPDGVYVDCTAGAGGHAYRIAERLAGGRLIALDRDPAAVAMARERLAPFPQAQVMHRNYSELPEALVSLGIDRVDGILLDAGVSSMQLDDPHRGFSFQQDCPLDMRMDTTQTTTAASFLAETNETDLAKVLKGFGDVRPARRIAQAIVARRGRSALNTTNDLAEAVHEALPFVSGTPNEVRTVFQAIRMAVNDELGGLRTSLEAAVDVLAPEGRLVAISFHSGEDRVVKNVLRDASRKKRELHPDGRVRAETPARLRILTPKPVQPDADEARANPRSKSARLRAAERLAPTKGGA